MAVDGRLEFIEKEMYVVVLHLLSAVSCYLTFVAANESSSRLVISKARASGRRWRYVV